MTAGALLQLQNGTSDRMAFLISNKQITHFKSVYKKYSNFSTEFINIQPILTSSVLSFDKDTKITFEIPRDGDAISNIYLTLELPDIYSDSNYQFQWIKRIGEYIIKDVSLQIDTNKTIDKHYSEWFHAYSELNYDEGKKKGYYRMIGNIPELYDPANAPGNGGIYPNNTRFAPHLPTIPSIINRKIYLPLIFWFNKLSSFSFPLIAIQKTIMNITFNFRRLQDLYTVVDYGITNKRIKPTTTAHYIGNFLNPQDVNKSSLYINPRLEINNIFLDNFERTQFALSSHEYLITQLQCINKIESTSKTLSIDLKNFNKPITQLIYMIRRSDMENINEWSNYTNWNIQDIPPYSNTYINPYGNALALTTNNIKYYKNKNLLKSAIIRIENYEITTGDSVDNDNSSGSHISGKDNLFFNLVSNFNTNRNIPQEGIYTYSFALDNTNLQPSGAINFSGITNKHLILNLTDLNPNETINSSTGTPYTYNYVINVFAVNYEILKIMGGMVGISSAN